MCKELRIFGVLFIGLLAAQSVGQTSTESQLASLCDLQKKVAQGEHRPVLVQGVYLSGLEAQYLVASGCAGRNTAVEFDLRSHRLWKRLMKLLTKTSTQRQASGDGDPVLVVFQGEFYGPQVPNSKLPEGIRKNYHPGWDHMNASMTR